jgi:hypothetical protein
MQHEPMPPVESSPEVKTGGKIGGYLVFLLIVIVFSLLAGGKGATSEFKDDYGRTVECYHPEPDHREFSYTDCKRK